MASEDDLRHLVWPQVPESLGGGGVIKVRYEKV